MMVVLAATEENQKIINEIIVMGVNDYNKSPYLKKGIANPIYRMIEKECFLQKKEYKIIKNSLAVVSSNDEIIGIFSPNTPNLPISTRKLLNNKRSTKKILALNSIPVPNGMVFIDLEKAKNYFKHRGKAQVVKPLTGSGGRGVTANINYKEHDELYFQKAFKFAKSISNKVIVEDYIEGDEVRIFVLDGKVEAAICRLPAYVVGNGENTILELIEIKNKSRALNPLLKLYPIRDYDDCLSNQGLTSATIPKEKQYIKLSNASNIAQGGDSVSIIDKLHPSIIEMCERVWLSIPGATQIGLDVILSNFIAPVSENNFCVIEVNADPAVATPTFAEYGMPATHLPKKLVEYVTNNVISRNFNSNFQPVPKCFESSIGENIPSDDYIQINLVRKAAFVRGLTVHFLDHVTSLISLANEEVLFWKGIPNTTLISTTQFSSDKILLKKILRLIDGVILPECEFFDVENRTEALKYFNKLNTNVVIKSILTSDGFGVETNVNSDIKLFRAIDNLKDSGVSKFVCEKHINGRDYSLLITKKGYYAVINRIPAFIIGDGIHTICQLIEIKNLSRSKNIFLGRKKIIITDVVVDKIKELGLTENSILLKGMFFQLDTVANIGVGGESLDVTDFIHPDWLPICEAVRLNLFNATHVSIDLIAQDISLSPSAQDWAIIDVNSNPDYGLHHFPIYGQSRDAAGSVIDSIFDHLKISQVNNRLALNCRIPNTELISKIKIKAFVFGLNCSFIPEMNGTYSLNFDGCENAIFQFKSNFLNKLKMQILTSNKIVF